MRKPLPPVQKSSLATVYSLLSQYKRYGVMTRQFMLKEQYELLLSCKATESADLNFVKSAIYRDLLQRLHELINDFTMLSFALWFELETMPYHAVIGRVPSMVLERFTEEKWTILFRYSPIEELSLGKEDQDFLQAIRQKNLDQMSQLIKVLQKFWKVYHGLQNKLIHSHSLVFGFRHLEHGQTPGILLPMTNNLNKPHLVTGYKIDDSTYFLWQRFYTCLSAVLDEIIDRAMKVIERQSNYLVESRVFYQISDSERKRLDEIIANCDKKIPKIVPTNSLKWSVSPEAQKSGDDLKTQMTNLLESMGF